jgi:protein kinase-like protein
MSSPPSESAGVRRSDSGSLKPGETLSGKYKVEKLLGEGGMGEVFVAEDNDLGRRVAIKVLRGLGSAGQAAAEERLRREARTLAAIGHPNIVQIFDIGRTDGGAPFLPVKKAVEIVADVLSALQAVHAKGMVHRDMKPENVFLARDANGREMVKLLDLGIAKALVPEANTPALTETGAIVGTPYYMAPEQAMGVADIDGRADLYAVGGILYTLLVGKTPFSASNVLALLRMIVDTDPIPAEKIRDEIPLELGGVIRKAMARARNERFADAKSFLEALAPFATLIMPRHDLGRPTAPGSTASTGKRMVMYGLIGVVLAGLLAGALAAGQRPHRGARARRIRRHALIEKERPLARAAAVPQPPAAAARHVFLEVAVTPASATATLDGQPLSDGGFVVAPSDRLRHLVVSAEGFVTKERELIVQQNDHLDVALDPDRSGHRRHAGHAPGEAGTYRGNIGISSKNPYPGH